MAHTDREEFRAPIARSLTCQVLVAGAGPAGLMAAIAAARDGADVILVERYGFVGGMLTAGEVRNIRVMNDGAGNWIIGGAPMEYLKELIAYNGALHDAKEHPYVQHSPEITKFVGEKLCLKYGVRILYHSWVCGAIMDGNAIKGVYVLEKDGISAIRCDVAIDATGDGDLAVFAGAAYEKSDLMQPMTTTFLLGGVRFSDEKAILSEESKKHFKEMVSKGLYPVPRDDLAVFQTARPGEVYCNITRCVGDSTVTEDLTNAEITCREQIFNCVAFLRREIPEFRDCYLIRTAPQVGIRESRRIKGMYTLTEEDVVSGKRFEDDVALNAYFIDIHHQDDKTTHYKKQPGTYNGIPYRCLLPEKIERLLVCGRCISATHIANGAIRVMGTAMGMGEAAGTAAAMAAAKGVVPRELDIHELQDRLRKVGVPI